MLRKPFNFSLIELYMIALSCLPVAIAIASVLTRDEEIMDMSTSATCIILLISLAVQLFGTYLMMSCLADLREVSGNFMKFLIIYCGACLSWIFFMAALSLFTR